MKAKSKISRVAAKAGTGSIERAIGRREQNKAEKLHRIKKAARELFISKGFDETTIREIAAIAEVGLGTVFVYAQNKRDLLFLIFNDGLEEAARKAKASIGETAPLVENLLSAFHPLYQFFARQPALSRLALREMTFYDSGIQAQSFQKTREALIELLGDVVRLAAAQKSISTRETPQFVGWVIFCIYQVELRRWLLGNDLDLREGMAHLRRALVLFANGLNLRRRHADRTNDVQGPRQGPVA
jgi:AcrR family transcriptional regulator